MKYQSVFKRYEKKYRLDHEQYILLKKELDKHMEEDKYGLYKICNLYFDNSTYEVIRRSIEKPIYKEKLRVRSYGVPKSDDTIFFELKKKYNREVFKRRISLTMNEFEQYLEHGKIPNVSTQILSEIEWFMKIYEPYPKIYISYDRLALFGKENPNIRVTFDKNIKFRDYDLNLSKGDYGTHILNKEEYIMEIKVEGAMPLWLSDILARNNILPISFSKYGRCYTEYLLNKHIEFEQVKRIV